MPEQKLVSAPSSRAVGLRTIGYPALAAGLGIAVPVVPGITAAWLNRSAGVTVAALPDIVARGFDEWVSPGTSQPGAEMVAAVAFWRDFHSVKAVLAAGLVAVLVVPLLQIRVAMDRASGLRRRLLLLGVVIGQVLTAIAVVVVLANIQGALAPLSSVLSFLPADEPTPAMLRLRDQLSAGTIGPTAQTLLDDFRLYHAALAACAAVVVIVLAVVIGQTWRRWSGRWRRWELIVAEVVPATVLVVLAVVLAANISTVADTTPALIGFLGGGM